MDVATLEAAIKEVCPVTSVTMESDDRLTWKFVPAPEATSEQIYSGHDVIATIPLYPTVSITVSDWIARWTNTEYRAATATTWRQTAGNAKNWDIVIGGDSINFNSKKSQTLKTSLVTDGILTQVRADEIFS
jgi:hypothetical protein